MKCLDVNLLSPCTRLIDLLVENINNPRLLELISAETNVAIGGRLYSDALSEIKGPADTYLKMILHVKSLIPTPETTSFTYSTDP